MNTQINDVLVNIEVQWKQFFEKVKDDSSITQTLEQEEPEATPEEASPKKEDEEAEEREESEG